MLTTSLSQDLYKRFVAPAAERRAASCGSRAGRRWSAAAMGVALAIASPASSLLLTIFYTLLGVSLFVPILAGLYVPRAGTPEALAAIACGVTAMVGLQFATGGRGVGL